MNAFAISLRHGTRVLCPLRAHWQCMCTTVTKDSHASFPEIEIASEGHLLMGVKSLRCFSPLSSPRSLRINIFTCYSLREVQKRTIYTQPLSLSPASSFRNSSAFVSQSRGGEEKVADANPFFYLKRSLALSSAPSNEKK